MNVKLGDQCLLRSVAQAGRQFAASIPFGLVLMALMPSVLPEAPSAQAEETWEYAPYRIRVWLAAESAAELTGHVQDQILSTIVTQAPIYAGATWDLNAGRAPEKLVPSLLAALADVTVQQVSDAAEDVFESDKVMLLTVAVQHGDYVIACRELDCRTRTLGQVVRSTTWQKSRLPRDAAAAVAAAFSALVRVEDSRGKSASARVRAGGLVRHDYCPSIVTEGDVLRPVIRRNDRNGDPRPGGIQEIEWTYLAVRHQRVYLLDCEVLSAMRNPLTGRKSATVERMALKVRPRGKTTWLRLESRGTDPRPLEGYEIFAKKPLPKETPKPESSESVEKVTAEEAPAGEKPAEKKPEEKPAVKNKSVRLGLTDWRGMIEVPKDVLPARLVYVKNGNHLIARLPIVPGYKENLVVQLTSDDKRLETEAFVKGMESTVMDLVARREILGARIRRRLKDGKVQQARELLEEIKTFRTKDELERMITNRQQAGLSSKDEREQQRIDMLLSGTRTLLKKYLDPDKLVALQREVEKAEKGSAKP